MQQDLSTQKSAERRAARGRRTDVLDDVARTVGRRARAYL